MIMFFFVGLIVKENIDDIIFLDEKFNIQGMSLKLMKILNINNKNLFQENEIPFYVICRKFVNFYNIFLYGKKKEDLYEKHNIYNDEDISKDKDDYKNEENQDNIEKDEIHENIEINENVELEYEIKLPQFLIDFSEKSNKNERPIIQLINPQSESEEITEIIEEFDDEEDYLMEEERKEKELKTLKKNNSIAKSNMNVSDLTPIPENNSIMPTPLSESMDEDSDINNAEQNIVFNKESEIEKVYKLKINKYKTLFDEGKINELEELIDVCNKNSSSLEYKFNFTFDKYKYNNKHISYIVRCIDNKNDNIKIQEDSLADLDSKVAKYKREKNESIRPLFELLEEERKEILELPSIFLTLSLENKKFQKLLQSCKDDINMMSKLHGDKKDDVIEDENSSQTSQTGFDSGLVRKNRIEEIRSTLMNNISSFYTLKYIRILIFLISFCSIIFACLYFYYIALLFVNLANSSNINIKLYQSTLWTTELISIFINLRVLYLKEIINKYNNPQFRYNDFYTNNTNISTYYKYCVSKSLEIYANLSNNLGYLEMEIPAYLSEEELNDIYWDKVDISYMNENYKMFSNEKDEDFFPMAIAQILSSSLSYLSSPIFNSILYNTSYFNEQENNKISFDYMTFNIIENGYNNILPNLFNKLMIIPNLLSKFNTSQIKNINICILIYFIIVIILCFMYFIFLHFTNKSMIDGMDKVSKIKNEKIEEIIKRIKLFNINLKKFREKEINDFKDNSEIDDDSKQKSMNKSDLNNEKKKKKIEQESIGFNSDYKRYIPLHILKYSFIYPLFILLYIIVFIIPIYCYSRSMINNTNHLLIVQNYIYSNLIITSTYTIEIKCFISDCKNITKIDPSILFNYNILQDIIRGLNLFPRISNFYNEKYLLNACAAAINKEKEPDKYNNCLEDFIIKTSNNTENLLKLIEELIYNIHKEYDIKSNKSNSYNKINLFNEESYSQIEKIFFNYFMPVEDNFVNLLFEDLTLFYFLNIFN